MFSKDYLIQGLVLIQSLLRTSSSKEIWVLAFDRETFKIMSKLNLNSVVVVNLEEEQILHRTYMSFRKSRSISEAIFSLKPHWIDLVLSKASGGRIVFYADADSMFFQKLPSRMIEREQSIFVSPHRFGAGETSERKVGRYNAGFVGFRKDRYGLTAIRTWKALCDDWCKVDSSTGRYADQKYLENISEMYSNHVYEMEMGINMGNWSFHSESSVLETNGFILIDNSNLVSFHYHCVQFSRLLANLDIERYTTIGNSKGIYRQVYMPYLRALSVARKDVVFANDEDISLVKFLIPRGMTLKYFVRKLLTRSLAIMK